MARAKAKELVPVKNPVDLILPAIPAQVSDQSLEIAKELVVFAEEANKAVVAATRIEVKDQASYNMATDVAASIRKVVTQVKTTRKFYSDPLDKAKRKLIELFDDTVGTRLEASVEAISRKMSAWRRDEEDRRRREAEAEQRRIAAEAKALADAARAMGDAAGAQQIIEEAATVKVEPVKVTGSGAFGAATVSRKLPTGTVVDKLLFLDCLLSVAKGGPGTASRIIDSIEFSKIALNALAKELLETESPANTVPGFAFEYIESTSFRS